MKLRIFRFFLPLALLALSPGWAPAQASPSAYGRQLSITAGALGSAFQPDYQGGGVPSASPNALLGVGAYADVQFTRWFGVEAEGRWMRFNQFANIDESNYLIGYRLPLQQLTFWNLTPYGKVLVGYGKMNFEYHDARGRFTDIAYGGGLDLRTRSRLVIRPVDFEYQQWPNWLGSTLHPWGFSAGVGWRILGR